MPSSTQDWTHARLARRGPTPITWKTGWRVTTELVDKYQPQLVWFDWWIEQTVFQPYLQRFAAYYYNRGLDGTRAWRSTTRTMPTRRTAVLDIERGQLKDIRPILWQNDTSVSKNSWGYVADQDYKTAGAIIGDLVDVVSKNGGTAAEHRAAGRRHHPAARAGHPAREIGRWLAVNGEAIYGTRPWRVYRRRADRGAGRCLHRHQPGGIYGRDFRFTQKAGALYAICLARPSHGGADSRHGSRR